MFGNARITLITPNEVKKYSPADTTDSTSVRENFIILKEEKLFNMYFGWDFYVDLIDTKIDYETLSTYKGDYSPTEAYVAGDSVQFIDELFIALNPVNGVAPNDKTNWAKAPKFTNDNYNYLWERYLRQILAFNVLYTSVLYSALKATSKGLTKSKDESFDSASLNELQTYKKGMYNDIEDLCYAMDLYIMRNEEKYPLYKPIQEKDECGKTKTKKLYPNYGFNVGGSKYANKPKLEDL